MSKRLYFIFPVLVFIAVVGSYNYHREFSDAAKISELRKSHTEFLAKKKYTAGSRLSKAERIQKGLPPNQYYEEMALLTMNPALGYPEYHKKRELQEELIKRRRGKSSLKAPGDSKENSWISRGPGNVGGRTRVLLFDPNDATGKRVFAGAISGGLWVNNDITKESSGWQQVSGMPGNANISSLTVDPYDSNVWYAGTGEQYTAGDVVGSGVYKTTDAGSTWTKILDIKEFSRTESYTDALAVGGLYYINDIMAWDNGESTEIFLAVSTHVYDNANDPSNYLGYFERGLYSSKDGGETWIKVVEEESFNDFETDAAGNFWAATTTAFCNLRGGKIYRRNKGTETMEFVTEIPDVARTEIEASATNPDKFYILAEKVYGDCQGNNVADLFLTTDAFSSITALNEPNDADDNIPADNFARDLPFYALMIESDPNNDNIVYAGSINLFRSENSGQSWQQISRTSEEGSLADLPVSIVHADHHVMQFRPANTNQAIFGHDGGVSYARDLQNAASSDVFFTAEKDYVTTQFYSTAVAPMEFKTGDHFLGGTQDNGTQLLSNNNREASEVLGGDGGYTFFDQVNTDYYVMNYIYNDIIAAFDFSQNKFVAIANNLGKTGSSEGFFINPQALDSNLDLLFSNGPRGTLYRYDDIDNLKPLVGNRLDDDSPVAQRTVFRHVLLETNPSDIPSITALQVSPYNTSGSTLLLGLLNGNLIKVQNAHANPDNAKWTEITGPQFVGSISDIEFGRTENEVFVTFYNYGVKSIWYSKNAFSENPTWTNKEGNLPDLPVLAILPNPGNENEVIIGTELGVWKTSNFKSDQPDWKQSYNGMSDVKVTDLDLKKGTAEVYAASYGRGIFSGQFTSGINPDKPGNPADAIVVEPTVSGGRYNIISPSALGNTRVSIYDLKGQLVQAQEVQIGSNFPQPIDLAQEASGLYLMLIEAEGLRKVQKIIKK